MIVEFNAQCVKSLKPCPFCGGDVSETDIVNDLGICFVMCENCGADGSAFDVKSLGMKFAKSKAVEA